jgi:hypothetical protein
VSGTTCHRRVGRSGPAWRPGPTAVAGPSTEPRRKRDGAGSTPKLTTTRRPCNFYESPESGTPKGGRNGGQIAGINRRSRSCVTDVRSGRTGHEGPDLPGREEIGKVYRVAESAGHREVAGPAINPLRSAQERLGVLGGS